MTRSAAAAIGLCALACGCSRSSAAPSVDRDRAARLFDQVAIATDNGMSGLAIDDEGAIWTESERDLSVFRIVLDGSKVASTVRYAVAGAPADVDLEALAWLGPGKLAFGIEGHDAGVAKIALADVDDGKHTVTITRVIDLPEQALGLAVKDNDGVEGLCGRGDTVIAAIESTATDAHGRWAPIVRVDLKTGALAVTQLGLTSDKGKLSSLDCRLDADGTAHLLAIERHFAITRLVRAELPAAPKAPARLDATVAIDLAPVLRGALNLEGIGVLRDGRVVAVVDNQYDRITGPNLLVIFRPGAVP
jgi:hypothetical protein